MSETLYDLAKQIKALMAADWQNNSAELSSQMAEIKIRFLQEIIQVNQPDMLQKIIELDTDLEMPFDIIQATYQQLLKLCFRDTNTLRNYAHYLLLHGPDWDAEANNILAKLSAEKATINPV
ncbi:hypothetical protein ACE1CI_12525 [Aerosakkonemataceae cyanobacterium BLCC-F50]|uniref:Uncharacterized protein n=1 Tax=Floridaenema flaviceps BLCC-F50 TaxID=3153642 RepID=A0ABV4XPZ1_9CYAN